MDTRLTEEECAAYRRARDKLLLVYLQNNMVMNAAYYHAAALYDIAMDKIKPWKIIRDDAKKNFPGVTPQRGDDFCKGCKIK